MRYFLIDKVTELVPGERARGVKNVTLSDEVLHDHFPDFPVMPGALVLEAAAQLGGLLVEATFHARAKGEGRAGPPRRALLVAVEKAKWHDATGPGDRLDVEVRLASTLAAAAQVDAEVTADGKRVMRAAMTFALRDVASERVHAQRRYVYGLWTRDLVPPPELP